MFLDVNEHLQDVDEQASQPAIYKPRIKATTMSRSCYLRNWLLELLRLPEKQSGKVALK
jgi:hypothetical protein